MSRPEDPTERLNGFLGRWARRKQEVQRLEAEPPKPAPMPEATDDEEEPPPLPSIDSIVPGSDVSAFFQKHVPEALRVAALRKLWVTDPEIRNFIEMADYQWDFNNPDSIPGWSSSVEGVDIKAMVDRVFGTGPVRDAVAGPQEEPDTGMAGQSASVVEPANATDPEDACENTETTAKNGPDHETLAIDEPDLTQFGATQQSTEESSVYDIVRKRHGGALPT